MESTEHPQRRALVVGLGIAGLSAAIGLRKAGWRPVIVERAPERRRGGYFVGIFPDGKKAANDLGMTRHLHTRNPTDGKDWTVQRSSSLRAGAGFLDRPGGPYAVVRGDIEDALWRTLEEAGGAEVRFDTCPVHLDQAPGAVHVRLREQTTGAESIQQFDLAIGADGVRSTVRELVFGPAEQFLDEWGRSSARSSSANKSPRSALRTASSMHARAVLHGSLASPIAPRPFC